MARTAKSPFYDPTSKHSHQVDMLYDFTIKSQYSSEEGDSVEAETAAMHSQLDNKHGEATAVSRFRQIWFTDCRSVHDMYVKQSCRKWPIIVLSTQIVSMLQIVAGTIPELVTPLFKMRHRLIPLTS